MYAILVAMLMLYFVGAAVYWRRAFLSLREKPYNQMRMAHQHLRLSVRPPSIGPVQGWHQGQGQGYV